MSDENLIPGTDEAWDSRELGASEAHAKRAPAELESRIEELLGMQMISTRLVESQRKAKQPPKEKKAA